MCIHSQAGTLQSTHRPHTILASLDLVVVGYTEHLCNHQLVAYFVAIWHAIPIVNFNHVSNYYGKNTAKKFSNNWASPIIALHEN